MTTLYDDLRRLLHAMETCHICEGTVLVEGTVIHCEDCSSDCDEHELPNCEDLYALHLKAKRALPQILADHEELVRLREENAALLEGKEGVGWDYWRLACDRAEVAENENAELREELAKRGSDLEAEYERNHAINKQKDEAEARAGRLVLWLKYALSAKAEQALKENGQ